MAGNHNSGRRQEKPFADALRIEIAALKGNRRGLRLVARRLIEKAESGELAAIKELADRTDGKPVQQNVNQHELDANPPVTRIVREILAPPQNSFVKDG